MGNWPEASQSNVPPSISTPPTAMPWPPTNFVERVGHDVGAMVERPEQVGRGEGVVDQQGHAALVGDGGHGGDVQDLEPGVAQRLADHEPGAVGDGACARRRGRGGERTSRRSRSAASVCANRLRVPPYTDCEHTTWSPALSRVGDGEVECRLPRRGADGADAAFERCHPFLEHGHGRIGNPAVDVPVPLEVEQPGGVVDVREEVRGRLVDRHGPSAEVGVGRMARRGAPACRSWESLGSTMSGP